MFVVVTIELPIFRPGFSDAVSMRYLQALAQVINVSSRFITIDAVQAGDRGKTVVTSNIATNGALSASELANHLSYQKMMDGLSIYSFPDCELKSVQLTACLPGQMLANQSCEVCPANFFCVGGTSSPTSCKISYFSAPGASSVQDCTPAVFVTILVSLPVSSSNFSDQVKFNFRQALASTANVKIERVVVVVISQERRTSGFSVTISCEIAAENSESAATVANSLKQTNLNNNLVSVGLPMGNVLSIQVLDAAQSSEQATTSMIAGLSVGGCVFLLAIAPGYYMYIVIIRYKSNQSFLAKLRSAKLGDVLQSKDLPFKLLKQYVPEMVVGVGAFGFVVRSRSRQTGRSVAIKLVLPQKGVFDEKEMRQLKREEAVLEFLTAKRCDHAVHLAGIGSVRIDASLSWYITELLDGADLDVIIHNRSWSTDSAADQNDAQTNPIEDVECIKIARCVLATLKLMHSEGLIHRDIKPANIIRCKDTHQKICEYKLIDFGSTVGVDDTIARESMMTFKEHRHIGAGTPQYMSPEMYLEPHKASYPSDLWSLGVTMFEVVTTELPFYSENELMWSSVISADLDQKAPSVLDIMNPTRRARFDHQLTKVISKALEKRVIQRYASSDEMHEAIYSCLVVKGEAYYSVFISYRVASEAPLARLIFDELNHSVTPGGHRVTVFWDSQRLVKGEDWEEGFSAALLNSMCFFPLLSYGFTAPLAALPRDRLVQLLRDGWEEKPIGRRRLEGNESDEEDNVLKEVLIATTLLDHSVKQVDCAVVQVAYPILVGRQHPAGHPFYPKMGVFFHVQGGGGNYSNFPSPATARAVARFLQEKASVGSENANEVSRLSIDAALKKLTKYQGCQLWSHPPDLAEEQLSKEQRVLIDTGYAGPPVDLGRENLSEAQVNTHNKFHSKLSKIHKKWSNEPDSGRRQDY